MESSVIRENDSSTIWIEDLVPVPIHIAVDSDDSSQINIKDLVSKLVIHSQDSSSNKPIRTSRDSAMLRDKRNMSKKCTSKEDERQCIVIAKATITNSTAMTRKASVTHVLRIIKTSSSEGLITNIKAMARQEISKTSSDECKMTFDVWRRKRREGTNNNSTTTHNTVRTQATMILSILHLRTGMRSRG